MEGAGRAVMYYVDPQLPEDRTLAELQHVPGQISGHAVCKDRSVLFADREGPEGQRAHAPNGWLRPVAEDYVRLMVALRMEFEEDERFSTGVAEWWEGPLGSEANPVPICLAWQPAATAAVKMTNPARINILHPFVSVLLSLSQNFKRASSTCSRAGAMTNV